MNYSVYILECADGTLYTGITTDIKRRIGEHNGTGNKSGAKYTSGRRPVKLVYKETGLDQSTALKREHQVKKMTKTQKKYLIYSCDGTLE